MNNRLEHVFHADAAFRADHEGIGGGNGEHIFDLLLDEIGLGGGQVNLINDRENGEVVGSGEKGVGDGLGFNALAGVHHQQGAFTSGKRAGDFVREIHVTRGINKVQAIGVAVFGGVVKADAFGLNGDAALALQVHGVQHLLVHLALGESAGHFEQAVGKGGLAVVNVRDDTEIAYELWV